MTTSGRILLTNARVIDGTGSEPRERMSVLVGEGRILAIGDEAHSHVTDGVVQHHDLGGRTVLPGFFDCHVHFIFGPDAGPTAAGRSDPVHSTLAAARRMERTLSAGVTTVRDLAGLPVGFRTAVDNGLIAGPRIQVAIKALSQTGGHGDGHRCGINESAHMSELVDTVDEARVATRRLMRDGADVIKLCASGGMSSPHDDPEDEGLTEEEMRAVMAEVARRRKIPVAAHAQGRTGILAAIRAGVTSIEHGYQISDEGCDLALAHGTFLVPTLRTGLVPPNPAIMPPGKYEKKVRWTEITRVHIADAIERGVRIAMGTDAGICSHGDNLEELALLVELGMTPTQAIVAATRSSAELLGVGDDLGTLETGKIADLVVVDTDPLDDIASLSVPENIRAVMKDGRWYRNELGAGASETATAIGM